LNKLQRISFELKTDERDIKKSAEDLVAEREKVRIFLERARKDLEQEQKRNEDLKRKLMENDGTGSSS
jgi:hypothetical protein